MGAAIDAFLSGVGDLLLKQGAWGLVIALLGWFAYSKEKENQRLRKAMDTIADARIAELKLVIETVNSGNRVLEAMKSEVSMLVTLAQTGRRT